MRSFVRVAAVALILSVQSCAGGSIHGLDEAGWFELLANGDPLPIAHGDRVDYDAIARLGPGAALFVGMRAREAGDDALAVELFRDAAARETGRYRTRAVASLAETLSSTGDGEALAELCRSELGSELEPYRRAYLEAVGYAVSGSHARTLAAIDALRSAFPAESSRDAATIASMALEAGYRSGKGRWVNEFIAITAMDGSAAVYEALAEAVSLVAQAGRAEAEAAIRAVGVRAFQLAEARALTGSRDYGPAVVAFRRYADDEEDAAGAAARVTGSPSPDAEATPSIPLSPKAAANLFLTLPRASASDAAKAYIAAAADEGGEGFRYIVETSADRGADPSRDYFDAFWRGRFLRAGERWAEAERWFSKAAALAANRWDLDAARWYEIEAASKRSAAAAVGLLGAALESSANPGYYSDLVEPISRQALAARDGSTLAGLDAATARAAPKDRARLAYLCARAAQIGVIRADHVASAFGGAFADIDSYAVARLREAYGQRDDPWYRLVAAYRLGEPLVEPLAVPGVDTEAGTEPTSAADDSPAPEGDSGSRPVSPDEYALALSRFGLGYRVRAELGDEYRSVSEDVVRTIAAGLAAAGRHDQAYRLIATLFWRAGFEPTRGDAELYWPRPYPEAIGPAIEATGLDPHLLYGLARSESAFDPKAVSKSGAVGLIQLMPATAAETAERLGLDDYELTDPVDNVTIGSSYFARLVDRLDGRVLPAVFSYNGGPTRFRRWEAEYGSLPIDLLLEALSYAETRQYGRNVGHAALSYAALYGEGDLRGYMAWLLGEGSRP
ncbi:MAG TPA: lytic transglycosylase domain-containing protein [Spirochaetia bacterium]|nr:lytic transglycosylase domain-containing protein [Spirochaetales bacterium]HRW24414.1 lytic transglycosylase domain-containing protein [Spirochaetia bacterium]